jgi:hypothetical protein
MDASFGFGASTYQTINFMSLLNESLATVDNPNKEEKSNVYADDNTHTLFGRPHLNIAEKMQCFNRLVFERSLLLEDLCLDCLADFIKVSYFSQKKYESYAQNYEEQLLIFNSSKLDSSLKTVDGNLAANSLINEVKELQNEYNVLLEEERQHDNQLQMLTNQERDYDQQISDAMRSLNVLEYQKEEEEYKLEDQYISSISAEQEIRLLSSPHFDPLFKLELLAVPPSLSSSILHSSHLPLPLPTHETTSSVVLAVNGFRASYSPISDSNLDWAEINAAWSNLCTSFVSYQQQMDTSATPAVGRGKKVRGGDITATTPGGGLLYSYDVRCLRGTGVLVESRRPPLKTRRTGQGKDKEDEDEDKDTHSYCLSYTAGSSCYSLSCPHTRGSLDEYTRAMLALAIVVIEVAAMNCRLDIMTSLSKLNYLYAYSQSHAVEDGSSSSSSSSGMHVHVDVLAWPSLDQLLLLPEMTRESDLRDLANEVLLSIYCLLM